MSQRETYSGITSGWLVPLRLVTFCLIAGVVLIWLGYPEFLRWPFLSYCLATLASLLLIVFRRRIKIPVTFRFFAALYFILEIVCESGIVYASGSHTSPFVILFLLTIVSAALLYRMAGTLVVATGVTISFGIISWLRINVPVEPSPDSPGRASDWLTGSELVMYSAFLYVLVFYLVAFIAGYLAEKLQSKDQELQTASNQLKKARLDTGDILRHLNSGLLTINRDGEIEYFNRSAELILELSGDNIHGRSCREVFYDGLSVLADNLLSVLNSRQRLARSEILLTTAAGLTVPIGISTSLLFDEQNEVRGVIAIFQDITEAKKLEERVRQSDRMAAVGELSAYIAHEIRNPLASISGSVEVLKNDLQLDGDNDRLLSLIIKESGRLNEILSDFLTYARIGRTQLRKVEANRIILDTIEVVRRHPSFVPSIRIELLSDSHLMYISGDENQLRQLMLNLAVNACQALGNQGGVIQFEVNRLGDPYSDLTVEVIIRDNGPGIESEALDKIFLPFYSTKRNGTGLGLAIVARLIEAHEGRIEVQTAPGSGTEFKMYFRPFETFERSGSNKHSTAERYTQSPAV